MTTSALIIPIRDKELEFGIEYSLVMGPYLRQSTAFMRFR